MTPTLPGDADEWADQLQAKLNDREAFTEAAAGFDATFRFDILPDERYDGNPITLTVVITDGACVAARGSDPNAEYDFGLRGPYAAWVDLLEDEIEVTEAVMGGAFEFEGSEMRLLNRREAVTELVRAAQSVDTEYAY
ncbi:SCP2 sterol-binding domain-containing protein [Halosimplex aquaticum]|uniref:SCP2 sterol-binding domain-containing protein n=1 Tax=Halosimplex aquaticum TaxID=3026162 RepID=A0ABD5Y7D0_9EURY|nr:SCP2 sterol-binding domain-containing protein [Halosimplex aquaticum]